MYKNITLEKYFWKLFSNIAAQPNWKKFFLNILWTNSNFNMPKYGLIYTLEKFERFLLHFLWNLFKKYISCSLCRELVYIFGAEIINPLANIDRDPSRTHTPEFISCWGGGVRSMHMWHVNTLRKMLTLYPPMAIYRQWATTTQFPSLLFSEKQDLCLSLGNAFSPSAQPSYKRRRVAYKKPKATSLATVSKETQIYLKKIYLKIDI